MANGLATHILRLSDVYLIYAEAVLGNSASTSDANALAAFNAVRSRAIPTANPKTSITFDDIWKERRHEHAGEAERWYDFVRLSYYDEARAINELKSQRRNAYDGYDTLAKAYYDSNYQDWTLDPTVTKYNTDTPAPNVTSESFTLPFPTEDLVYNKHLSEPAVSLDVRATYSY
jgi:hypothetical protein